MVNWVNYGLSQIEPTSKEDIYNFDVDIFMFFFVDDKFHVILSKLIRHSK